MKIRNTDLIVKEFLALMYRRGCGGFFDVESEANLAKEIKSILDKVEIGD